MSICPLGARSPSSVMVKEWKKRVCTDTLRSWGSAFPGSVLPSPRCKGLMTQSTPVIVSASRATDIPAFYAEWFMERLRRGSVVWTNPFNRKPMCVSFEKTRLVVFWSKNPAPLLPHLDELDRRGIHFYFQYTLNDYAAEGLEPGVPSLDARIDTFKRLAERVGRERVIWRFDPLLVSDALPLEGLLTKVCQLGERVCDYTEKLVFSFGDVAAYRHVSRKLKGTGFRELNDEERLHWAEGLVALNRTWGLRLATCAEKLALEQYGIAHNKCVDDELMVRLFPEDAALMAFIGAAPSLLAADGLDICKSKKDPGQRKACHCVVSKDIGAYNTCSHGCTYCYANSGRDQTGGGAIQLC